MELRINFYSKKEVAFQIDFAGRYPFPENEASELFLFTCYAIRQLSNLGTHDVAKVLALLLSSYTKNTAIELSDDTYKFPGSGGMGVLMGFQRVRLNMNYNVIQDQLLTPVPSIVKSRGRGKKAFILALPPSKLSTKGFGILGFQVNYYAFHSVISLFTYLARKHRHEEIYLDHLAVVAQYCGKAYFAGGISRGDQIPLANTILTEAGVRS